MGNMVKNVKMKIDHKIKIRNDWEKIVVNKINQAAQILADTLDLNNVTIRVERQAGWSGSKAFHSGAYVHTQIKNKKFINPMLVKINLRNLQGASLRTIICVLGHEFRHAFQDKYKVCDEIPDNDINKPSYIKKSYWNKPIEKDARKYQELYADIVYNDKDFFDEELPADIKPLLVNDDYLTYKKYGLEEATTQLWTENNKIYFTTLDDFNKLNGSKYKKWTNKPRKEYWELENRDKITTEFVYVKRKLTINDLIS
jgi:hypothetical protein